MLTYIHKNYHILLERNTYYLQYLVSSDISFLCQPFSKEIGINTDMAQKYLLTSILGDLVLNGIFLIDENLYLNPIHWSAGIFFNYFIRVCKYYWARMKSHFLLKKIDGTIRFVAVQNVVFCWLEILWRNVKLSSYQLNYQV